MNHKLATDEIYTTGNPVIRWLGNRLLKKIGNILLERINSVSLTGLDVGCGEGHMISYLHKKGVIEYLVAIDLNEERIEYAKTKYPVCRYLNADVNKLAFKTSSFGYIIAAEIMEHLSDPANAMKELKRVARNGSYIVISVPYEPFFHWGNLLRGKHWKRMGRTPAHVNFWNRLEFKAFLSKFVEIEEEYRLSTFPWLLYLGKFKTDAE